MTPERVRNPQLHRYHSPVCFNLKLFSYFLPKIQNFVSLKIEMSSSVTTSFISREQILVPTLRHLHVLNSSNDEVPSDNARVETNTTGNEEWFDPRGNQPYRRAFMSECGVDICNITLKNCRSVGDFYTLLVTG